MLDGESGSPAFAAAASLDCTAAAGPALRVRTLLKSESSPPASLFASRPAAVVGIGALPELAPPAGPQQHLDVQHEAYAPLANISAVPPSARRLGGARARCGGLLRFRRVMVDLSELPVVEERYLPRAALLHATVDVDDLTELTRD
eukprot:918589-Pleurochrysis_carterae.AAC.4